MNLRSAKSTCIAMALCVATAITSHAQQFTSLANFNGADGKYPAAPLVQGLDGNFYGTTSASTIGGTVFKVSPTGTLTMLHNFSSNDGSYPLAGLTQATNGTFYGTTNSGGTYNLGTIFKITPAGQLTTLYSFCAQFPCLDGSTPSAAPIQGTDGNLYGPVALGGAYCCGAVYRLTATGTLTLLYSFCPGQDTCPDGDSPIGPLVQASDGNFYGTTPYGGAFGGGTVFKISPTGQLTTLYSFCAKAHCSDGKYPYAGLVLAADGSFYGTTINGGQGGFGNVFKITPAGQLTALHTFTGSDGSFPYAGLVQATDGSFYGSTEAGGATNYGTIFKITSTGSLTVVYNLCSLSGCADGSIGFGGLIQGTDGKLYGPAEHGGTSTACPGRTGGCGTLFSLSEGLSPFVETLPNSGKVSATVLVLGNNLVGASRVMFNGVAATFTVVSNTEIKAKVPTGATTGTVEVVTPTGKLNSNVLFRVKP